MGQRRHPLLYPLIAAMVLFWSANFIIAKIALREFPALLVGSLRIAAAGLLMLPVYAWHARRSEREAWERSDVPVLLALGVLGITLNHMLFIVGIGRTSVGHAAFISALAPVLVLLLAVLARQEHLRARKAIGMAVAFSGVMLLNLLPPAAQPKGSQPSLFGDLLVFLASLTFAVFTVFGKSVRARHNSVTVSAFGYVGGGVALLPVAWWSGQGFAFANVTVRGWASLAYMAAFPSVVCYLIYYWALKYVPASRMSSFSYLQPAIALALAWGFLGERISLPVVAGGAIIFAGVFLAERG